MCDPYMRVELCPPFIASNFLLLVRSRSYVVYFHHQAATQSLMENSMNGFGRFGEPPLVIHVNFYTAKVDNVYFPQVCYSTQVIDTLLFRAKTLPVYSSPCLLAFVNISYGWQCRVWCLSSLSWLYVILLEIVQLEVVGDIANAMWQMKEILKNQPHWDFSFMMEVLLAQYL